MGSISLQDEYDEHRALKRRARQFLSSKKATRRVALVKAMTDYLISRTSGATGPLRFVGRLYDSAPHFFTLWPPLQAMYGDNYLRSNELNAFFTPRALYFTCWRNTRTGTGIGLVPLCAPGVMMLRKPIVTLLAIVAPFLVDATAARAATISITNSDSGWYDVTGFHDPNLINYIAGQFFEDQWRNFFVFDLSAAASETITGAQLRLYAHEIVSSGTYTTYDVTTPVPALTAGGSGLVATYDDLGAGLSFGSIALSPGQRYSLILISLNAAAIAAIQANAGGVFAIGGDYHGDGGDQDFAFGFSDLDPGNAQNQLILQTAATVPDGGLTTSLLGGSLIALGMLRRRFNS